MKSSNVIREKCIVKSFNVTYRKRHKEDEPVKKHSKNFNCSFIETFY